MTKRVWQFNPNHGGKKVPPLLQDQTRRRILQHAAKIGSSPKSVIAVYCGHFHRVTRWGRKRPEPLAS
ncbi:MAG: hypothetical protein ACRD3T_17140, partial [Terriglobia bacterium]